MICVKIYWNTEADGSPISLDCGLDDMPCSHYGPFDTMFDAIDWMENDYPDDDTDVHDMVADTFDIPVDASYLNHPDSIRGDIPDEDIRPEDTQEIHAP